MSSKSQDRAWSRALDLAAQDVVDVINDRRAAKGRPTQEVAGRLGSTAISLFNQRGFDNVTVADIAIAAGVTSRTFFRYYPTKETVVVDLFDRTMERLMTLVQAAPDGDSVHAALRDAAVRWSDEHSDLVPAMTRLWKSSQSLESAMLLRSVVWEEHLADALVVRFPALGAQGARIWAVIGFGLLRLSQHEGHRQARPQQSLARDVFEQFETFLHQTD